MFQVETNQIDFRVNLDRFQDQIIVQRRGGEIQLFFFRTKKHTRMQQCSFKASPMK